MGLDVYVGSLARYLTGDWELIAQTAAREMGLEIQVVRQHVPEDVIRDPDQVRPVVERWRTNLSEALGDSLPLPLIWDETPEAPYFTDKPAWDGYAGLVIWAAYDEQPHLPRPTRGVEEWGEDPAYKASTAQHYNSRYSHLYDVDLWLPCDFEFVFQADFVTGSKMLIGSSIQLSRQLDDLNRRTWSAPARILEQWAHEGADHGAPLETAARFAFALFKRLADQSKEHRLPMLLDS